MCGDDDDSRHERFLCVRYSMKNSYANLVFFPY